MSPRKVFVFLYALALAAVFCGASLNRALGQGPVAAPQNEVPARLVERLPHLPQRADTSSLSERARAVLPRSLRRPFRSRRCGWS